MRAEGFCLKIMLYYQMENTMMYICIGLIRGELRMITLNEFNALIKDNQVLASVMGLYGVGVLTFLIRNIPEKIYKILKRYLTTSITITSQNSIFHDTMRWFEKEFKNKNFRTIKLSNGKFGHGDKVVKSIGYGTHWCFL